MGGLERMAQRKLSYRRLRSMSAGHESSPMARRIELQVASTGKLVDNSRSHRVRVQWAYSLCSPQTSRLARAVITSFAGESIAHNEGVVDFPERAVPAEERRAA